MSDKAINMSSERPPKLEQALLIEPKKEFHFRGPYNDFVTFQIKLTNPTVHNILFKVKTTAPKRYCVRPNNGVIRPNDTIFVSLVMQPLSYQETEDQPPRSRDKFLIQSIYKPDDEDYDIGQIWKTHADEVMETRFKCVFDDPPEQENELNAAQTTAPAVNASQPVPFASHSNISKDRINESYATSNQNTAQANQVSSDENEVLSEPARENASKLNAEDLYEDNLRLQEELKRVQRNVIEAREEGLRRRVRTIDDEKRSNVSTSNNQYSKQETIAAIFNQPNLLALFFLVFIIGVFLGKFLL